jgi:hypothetical protein
MLQAANPPEQQSPNLEPHSLKAVLLILQRHGLRLLTRVPS